MRASVRKWGNSLALRIPRAIAEDSRIKLGSLVELTVIRGRLVVSPLSTPRYSLKRLLAGVTRTNRHPETDTGSAVGRESW